MHLERVKDQTRVQCMIRSMKCDICLARKEKFDWRLKSIVTRRVLKHKQCVPVLSFHTVEKGLLRLEENVH